MWQAGLTAAEMHQEHPERLLQLSEVDRALQVSSSGPLMLFLMISVKESATSSTSFSISGIIPSSDSPTITLIVSSFPRLSQAKIDGGRAFAFSTEWQAGLTAAEMHQEHWLFEWQPFSLRALQVSSMSWIFCLSKKARKLSSVFGLVSNGSTIYSSGSIGSTTGFGSFIIGSSESGSHAKIEAGRLLAFSTVWHWDLTADEMHQEQP